jgi:hypothetical protein
VFELCEDLLDGIEIGAVGRQEENSCAGGADQAADARALMGAEVVEDDDVAFFECWDESLLDISDETLAVDGALDNEWRIDPVASQRAAMKVNVFQRPWGAFDTSLRPLRPQPRSGVMFVFTQVSSMKTRRVGSTLA